MNFQLLPYGQLIITDITLLRTLFKSQAKCIIDDIAVALLITDSRYYGFVDIVPNKHFYCINHLLKSNNELKEENKLLAYRATNISYVTFDLNTKIKDLGNKKASLLTVKKIIQPNKLTNL